jgi:hypothetical protein
MRYLILTFWLAITVVLEAMIISDFLFGRGDARRTGARMLLALVWPLAALSSPGRKLLINVGKTL